jgi:hypothetical protein
VKTFRPEKSRRFAAVTVHLAQVVLPVVTPGFREAEGSECGLRLTRSQVFRRWDEKGDSVNHF